MALVPDDRNREQPPKKFIVKGYIETQMWWLVEAPTKEQAQEVVEFGNEDGKILAFSMDDIYNRATEVEETTQAEIEDYPWEYD